MKQRKMKCVLAILLAVSLLLPILPGMGTAVHATEPGLTRFATKDQLTKSFNLQENGTVGRIKFGANSREWLIAGLDTANSNTLVLLSTGALGISGYGRGTNKYTESDIVKEVLPGYLNGTSHFSDAEKGYMKETTVSTEERSGIRNTVTGKLYLADAQEGKNGLGSKTICVGTNNDIPIAIGKLISKNGFTAPEFWLRSPFGASNDMVLLVQPGGEPNGKVVSGSVSASDLGVVPAFNLNMSSVLFASAAPAATAEGALTPEDAMTLRYDAGLSLGTAVINPAQTSVGVSGAPEGTYLVVQNDSGAWAKAVRGDASVSANQVTIDGGALTSFQDCKVWLETTDITERITKAVMAVPGYETNIINPSGSHITRSTATGNGAETQIVAPGTAITYVVYTADSGYYFPENYSVAAVSGITVTRNNYTQITVSGTPTADAGITLTAATEKGEQNAPAGLSDGIEKIDGTKPEMEYAATEDAADWTQCTDNATAVSAGTWYVRYKGTDTEKASPATEVIVSAVTHTITADPAALNFDTVNLNADGSYTQPEAQTVTVRNTGKSAVTLTKPTSTGYAIGELSKATLGAGESATFTVQPKGDLGAGTYSETLEVTTDKGSKAEVAVNFTVEPNPEDAPKITKGAESKWTKGSKEGLSFTSNAEFDKFKKVMIDGKDTDLSHYTVKSGSTIVTLKAEYLETLTTGEHTVSIVSENGTADAVFTIEGGADKSASDKQVPSEKGKSEKAPQTGDNSNLFLWLILLALCGGSVVTFKIVNKKRSHKTK